MKKWLIVIGVLIVIIGIGIFAFVSKFYHPTLPKIDSTSKKEVLEYLNESSDGIVKIAEENSCEWYITRMEQGKAHENSKNMISRNGWGFQKQEGSG